MRYERNRLSEKIHEAVHDIQKRINAMIDVDVINFTKNHENSMGLLEMNALCYNEKC